MWGGRTGFTGLDALSCPVHVCYLLQGSKICQTQLAKDGKALALELDAPGYKHCGFLALTFSYMLNFSFSI